MKRRIIFICGGIILLTLIVTGIYLFSKPQSPKVPDYEELSELQLNSVKVKTDNWDRDMTTTLLAGIENAQPIQRIQARKIKNNEDYYVVALIDKSGNRTCLHFFEYEGKVYMTVNHKDVYTNVDFMYHVINGWTATGYGWSPVSKTILAADYRENEAWIKCAAETDYDVRSWLYSCVSANMAQGAGKEEAIESGAEYLLSQYKLYQYALENDYEIAENVYQQMIETDLDAVKARADYDTINAAYTAAGTTFEDYVAGNASFIWKIEYTIDYMKYCVSTQFREGEYTLDDISYDNAGSYRDAYMNHVIVEELEGIDTGTFEKDLEEAKQYVSELDISVSSGLDETGEESILAEK